MAEIVPTITAMSPTDYAEALAKLDFAPRLHIDITDGEFAPSRTVNLNQIYWGENKVVDLHLMIREPAQWLHQVISLNPSLAIFHAEISDAAKTLPKIREHLAKFGIKFGVAILPETRVENIREIIVTADYVLIFGGHLGFQGGTADLSQLAKVAQIREINKTCEIAWDGGANAENVHDIATAGVDVINVGSTIAKSDNSEQTWRKLSELVK